MAQANRAQDRFGSGCLLLFSLPFAAVGLAAVGVLAWGVYQELRMRAWIEVPCRILKAELEVKSDGDGTSYSVKARYGYRVDGQDYTGDQVQILSFLGDVGADPRGIYAELEEHRVTGRAFRCYVNPSQPKEAILYRQLYWGAMAFIAVFALTFGGFGLGMWTAYFWKRGTGGSAQPSKAVDAAQPWTARADWAQGRIRFSQRNAALGRAAAAVFVTLISLPCTIASSRAVANGDKMALLGLLYGVLAIGLWLWAARAIRQWRAFGESLFEMAATPGVIGGSIAGVIRVPARLPVDQQPLRLTLRCVQRVDAGDDSHSDETVWQSEQTVVRLLEQADFEQSAVPVLFNVPYDAPPSNPDAKEPVKWMLELKSDGSRPPYRAEFEAPMFVTTESRPDAEPDASAVADYAVSDDAQDACTVAGIEREPLVSGYRYYFRPRRAPVLFIPMGIFLALLIAGTVAIIHFRGQMPLAVFIIGLLFLGLFDVLLFLAFADSAFHRSMVEVSREGLVIRSGWLGYGKQRVVEADAVRDLAANWSASVNAVRYFNVVAQTAAGKNIVLGKYIRDRVKAENLVRQMLGVLRGSDETQPS
jgi:hypothetical protein